MRLPIRLALAALAVSSLSLSSISISPLAAQDRGEVPPATTLVLGLDFSCALDATGEAFCWGANHAGQLGARTPERCGIVGESGHRDCYMELRRDAEPVAGSLRFASLAAGEYHACGLTADGRAHCWGANRLGQLGAATTDTCLSRDACSPAPREVEGGHRWRALHAYETRTCGVAMDGALFCWGEGFGRTPTPVHPEMRFSAFAMEEWYCGTVAGGATHCWGDDNRYGELGTGDTLPHRDPAPVAGGLSFAALTIADMHACGLTAAGEAYCWGLDGIDGPGGSLGTRTEVVVCGFYRCARRPVAVTTDVRFRVLGAGANRTCGLDGEGRAYCWGSDAERQLGLGDDKAPDRCGHPIAQHACARSPLPVAGALRFRTLAVGQHETCGVTRGDGEVYCWGRTTRGVPRRVLPADED